MEDRNNFQSQDGLQSDLVETLWWVVFEEGDGPIDKWWHLFTRPNFRHCFAYSKVPDQDLWVCIDPVARGTLVKVVSESTILEKGFGSIHECMLSKKCVILPANGVIGDDHINRLSPYSCVEVVKHLLGINKRLLFTPFQLYEYIVENRLNMFEYNSILDIVRRD